MQIKNVLEETQEHCCVSKNGTGYLKIKKVLKNHKESGSYQLPLTFAVISKSRSANGPIVSRPPFCKRFKR